MTLSLSELQTTFSKALHYQASGDECDIVADHFTADERLQIYRNNFIIGLSEVITLTYPCVLSLVGKDCFNGLARKHVLISPLMEGDVASYGEGFAETIESVDSVIQSVPYLSDIARFEWTIDNCNQKHNNPTPAANLYSFDQLHEFSSKEQENITLSLYSTLTLISSNFSIFSIRKAIKNNCFEKLVIDKPEQGIVYVLSKDEILIEKLTSDEYLLLEQIAKGYSIGQIDQYLLAHLQKLISLNLFVGFQINKQSGEHND